MKNRTAQVGDSAWNTAGSLTTWLRPRSPITTNQTNRIGPNSHPIVPDPNRCRMNRPSRIATDSGTTRCASAGVATCTPWIAPSTEIAGVIMPSPKNSAAPKIPSVTSSVPWTTLLRRSSAVSAMIPPSPRLCARMMKPAYLIDTTIIRAQKIRDAVPYTVAGGDVRRGLVRGEDGLIGVQRAGADVPVHDAERTQRHNRRAPVSDHVPVGIGQCLEPFPRRLRLLGVSACGRRSDVAQLVGRLVEASFHTACPRRLAGLVPCGRFGRVRRLMETTPPRGGHRRVA